MPKEIQCYKKVHYVKLKFRNKLSNHLRLNFFWWLNMQPFLQWEQWRSLFLLSRILLIKPIWYLRLKLFELFKNYIRNLNVYAINVPWIPIFHFILWKINYLIIQKISFVRTYGFLTVQTLLSVHALIWANRNQVFNASWIIKLLNYIIAVQFLKIKLLPSLPVINLLVLNPHPSPQI